MSTNPPVATNLDAMLARLNAAKEHQDKLQAEHQQQQQNEKKQGRPFALVVPYSQRDFAQDLGAAFHGDAEPLKRAGLPPNRTQSLSHHVT
jgi:hypothetical protein